MVFICVIAGTVIGMAAFVLLTQTAVRNGIRMSGLIDWRTQYELERIDDADGDKPTLRELYEIAAKTDSAPDAIERNVRAKALNYIESRNSIHVRNCWIVIGVAVGVVFFLAMIITLASGANGTI
ncbi:hypothetical protein ACEWFW_10410 [Bifidobacterium catenulatum subsp. kashiwanohense]|uniref:hypothetical protein n=1 Tax=Bifidobacterium catenulatum TaxID=1686 RepID=UPI003D0693DE